MSTGTECGVWKFNMCGYWSMNGRRVFVLHAEDIFGHLHYGGLIHQTREPTRILLLLIIDKCNPMMKTERLSVIF